MKKLMKQDAAGATAEQEPAGAPPSGERPAIPEINEVNLVGTLVNDPWIKEVAGGHKRASFMLNVPRTFRNGEGERQQEKSYVPIVAWRAVALQCEGLRKGDTVQVDGRIKTWSKDKQYHWEVEAHLFQVLDRQGRTESGSQKPQASAPREEALASA